MSKRIIILAKYASSKDEGFETRTFALARKFVKKGHKVDLFTSDSNHLAKFPNYRNIINKKNIDGVNVFCVDLNSKHGVIQKGRTTLHDTFFHGDEIYRDEPNIFHVNNSKYTSCDLDHPHYYLSSNEMKMIPGDRIIARPLWLYIHDIPIIGIPLAVFPSKGGGRRSGWIMPSFGTSASRGTYFRHLGLLGVFLLVQCVFGGIIE